MLMLRVSVVVLVLVLLSSSALVVHAIPPVERIWGPAPVIVDANYNPLCCFGLYHANVNERVFIQSNLTSSFNAQSFMHIIKVTDNEGVTVHLSWVASKLNKDESTVLTQSWIPDRVGLYIIERFVWDSLEDPAALGSTQTAELVVTSDKAGDFNIRISPRDIELREGESANVGVILTSINGFDSKVNLSIEVSCKCLEVTLKPDVIVLSPYREEGAVLTVKVTHERGDWEPNVPLAYTSITVTGGSLDGLLKRSAQLIIAIPQS